MSGQLIADATGGRWWFDSGSLALDLAYTGALGDGAPNETLHAPADLGAWIGDRFDEVDAASADDRDLADALALRGAIARLALASAHGSRAASADVDVVNLFAATPDIPPVLAGGSRRAGRSHARVGQALSRLARQAIVMFGEEGRLRECAADDCHVVFYDASRSGSRRWCSMQRCGNRAKVRAHRARA